MGKRNKISRIDAQLAAARIEKHNEAVRANHAAQIAELPPGWQSVTLQGSVLPVPEVPQKRRPRPDAQPITVDDMPQAHQPDQIRPPSLVSAVATLMGSPTSRADRRRAQRANALELATARRGLQRRQDARRRTDALRERLGIPSKGE
jgi:hypothetical protein